VVCTTDVSRTSWQNESVGRLVGLLVGRMEILLGTISLSTTTVRFVTCCRPPVIHIGTVGGCSCSSI